MIIEASAVAHTCRSLGIDPCRAFPPRSAQRERAEGEWRKVTDEAPPTADEWAEVARLIQKHTGLKVTPPAYLRGKR